MATPAPSVVGLRSVTALRGERRFVSKTDLMSHLRAAWTRARLNDVFHDDVFWNLATYHHYGVVAAGLPVSGFRRACPETFTKGHPKSEWTLQVRLIDRPPFPPLWRPFSAQKCLVPWDFERAFKAACRRRFGPLADTLRGPACQDCGREADNLDVDHVDPEMSEVVRTCWTLVSAAERADWMGHRWIRAGSFKLSDGHPATQMFDRMHADGQFRTVCKKCHKRAAQGRAPQRQRRKILQALPAVTVPILK